MPPAVAQTSTVEGSITEDELDLANGLPWAANGWEFSETLSILDSLTNTDLGRVVIDRHGIDRSSNSPLDLIADTPFNNPEPGILINVSIWGSKVEGCFAALIFQYATAGEALDRETVVPTLLELGISGQILQLLPAPSEPRAFYSEYAYTQDDSNLFSLFLGAPSTSETRQGILYTGQHLFLVSSTEASVLSNAPVEDIRMRVTFADNSSIVVPIGEDTVRRWRDVYSFNPYCLPPEQLQALTSQPAPEPALAPPAAPSTATAPTDTVIAASNSSPTSTPPAEHSTSTPSPSNSSHPSRTVGEVALVAIQTLDNIQLRIDGATVRTTGSYTVNFTVENFSQDEFGFVPTFARVENASGERVTARITVHADESFVSPGASLQGQIEVLGQNWNESGTQNLLLIIREGTTGGREFRVGF